MRLIFLLLFPVILIGGYSRADTLSDMEVLMASASKSYKSGDSERTISLYEQAESLGSPAAMLRLSSIYKDGRIVEKDDNLANQYLLKAKDVYEKRANEGDAEAQYRLGRIYGHHMYPPDKLKAYNWYLLAANQGNMYAQYFVALTLNDGTTEPDIKRNPEEAMIWYEKSALQGYSRAALALIPKNRSDLDTVLKWCMPVAKEKDDIYSDNCLELINVTINRSIFNKKDKQKGIDALHELADSNIVMSQLSLSQMYKDGRIVDKDLDEAKKWSDKAFNTAFSGAKNGDMQSQYELYALYSRGIGTDIDLDLAKEWLSKSAKQGYRKAVLKLADMNKRKK